MKNLSTSRSRTAFRLWLRAGLLIPLLCSLLLPFAMGLDPSKSLSQYVHEKWQADKGFVGGEVNAISESGDGYLWIGTERGLVRFDGANFMFIRQPIPDQPPTGPIRGLLEDPQGDLWVRLDGTRLLRYHNGRFEDAIARFGLPRVVYTAMAKGRDGTVYFAGLGNRIYSYRNGAFTKIEGGHKVPGTVISIAQTRDQTLWLGTRDDGLWCRDGDRFVPAITHPVERNIDTLLPANNGGLWIGTDHGLVLWDGHKLTPMSVSPVLAESQIVSMSMDADNNIWMGTDHGLIRFSAAGQISVNPPGDPRQPIVTSTYVDRQGDLWFGGPDGVERLNDGKFTAFTTQQGLPTDVNGAIYADSQGRIWVAPLAGGLYWFKSGEAHQIALDGLKDDVVYSIGGGDGEVLLGRQKGGLTELAAEDGTITAKTYTQHDGLPQNSIFSVFRDHAGVVWAGTVSGGVSRLRKGSITTFDTSSGLSSNTINTIAETPDGRIWLGTPNGLDSYTGTKWVNYTTFSGLPSTYIRTVYADHGGVLWIATTNGLAYFSAGHIQTPQRLPEPLREPICGMAEDTNGELWITTPDHVIEVSRDKVLADAVSDNDVRSYGILDGLPAVEGVNRDRTVVRDNSNRIWMSLSRGLAMTDQKLSELDTLPLSVRMDSVVAGHEKLSLHDTQDLKTGSNQITFTFGANALANLSRIRFRYKLNGYDSKWSDISNRRQVTYANLEPGRYRFEVIASNAAGLWNGPQTSIPFVIQPAYWQTWWFRTVVLLGCMLLFVLLHRLRTYQVVHRLNMRFQERLAERTRIAQELHDTLLQGVLSASMQLDIAEDQLSEDSPAKPRLQKVIRQMRQVTEEGRSALRGLRVAENGSSSLEQSFSRVPMELGVDNRITFRVISSSSTRPVRPPIRDEVYRIGREALANAFHHAEAENVEVEVEYGSSYLRVLVRDDGRGIDPEVLAAGRDGHWGLVGMRERSERIGARLRLRTRVDAGTEVELTIPGAVAFTGQNGGASQLRRWFISKESKQAQSSGKREV